MEQITAKDFINEVDIILGNEGLNGNQITSIRTQIKELLPSLRSVSKTRPKFFDKEMQNDYDNIPFEKKKEFREKFYKNFPVSEVGQMEDHKISTFIYKVADKVKKKSHGSGELAVIGEHHFIELMELFKSMFSLPVPNTKTVEGDTLILEIAVDVERELRRVMKENDITLDDYQQDKIHRNVTGIFDHNKSKYLRMLSSLRSNEPEREGKAETSESVVKDAFDKEYAEFLKANEDGGYDDFLHYVTSKYESPSPPLKALSEERKRNWEEDLSLHSGNYRNKCKECDNFFLGNKYRRTCKTCSNLNIEISDEQIFNKTMHIHNTTKGKGFIEGAQWYREELKKRLPPVPEVKEKGEADE